MVDRIYQDEKLRPVRFQLILDQDVLTRRGEIDEVSRRYLRPLTHSSIYFLSKSLGEGIVEDWHEFYRQANNHLAVCTENDLR